MGSRLVAPLLYTLMVLSGCRKGQIEKPAARTYVVTSPLRLDTQLTRSYVAQIHAIQHIELRALERGYLEKVFVDEGQHVKKSDKLMQIRPAVYQAEQEKAAASAQLADIEYDNTNTLAKKNVVSPKELAMAKARATEAKANLNLATVRKGMTEFKAPFDGTIGLFGARVGSLLDEGDLLTTLSDTSKLWVYFNVSEPEYLEYQRHLLNNKVVPVRLMMADGRLYEHLGKVETIESDFNNATGNIAFRAGFDNTENLLRHGETGKILLDVPLKNALLIPQEATFDVLDKKFVYRVDEHNVVHSQPITIAAEMPQVYAIAQGLTPTDKIVVEELRSLTEGATIKSDFKQPDAVIKSLQVVSE